LRKAVVPAIGAQPTQATLSPEQRLLVLDARGKEATGRNAAEISVINLPAKSAVPIPLDSEARQNNLKAHP
jgi:hypothetical protein